MPSTTGAVLAGTVRAGLKERVEGEKVGRTAVQETVMGADGNECA
jgi:hypothetical protein